MEQLVVFVPALWLFSTYMSANVGALLGVVFIVSRALYAVAYLRDPRTRMTGIVSSFVVLIVLLAGAAIGVVKTYATG
jgi:nitrate reductase gamma subunit